MIHPYIQAYLHTNGKHNKILELYNQLQRNQLQRNKSNKGMQIEIQNKKQNGGSIIIDNFVFDENISINNNNTTDISIFIGKVSHCLSAIIYSNSSNIINVNYFSYDKICNITKNLEKGDGTSKMMNAFFKYIELHHPKIDTIILTDKSELNCSNINISLYMLYMLKYHTSYYEKRHGFIIDKFNNSKEKIKKHNENKIKSQKLKIDKTFIANKLEYYDNVILDEFIANINDGELVSEFLKRFNAKEQLCDIFNIFLQIIYTYNKLDKSVIVDGIVFIKYLHQHRRNTSLTKKSSRFSKSKTLKKNSI